MIKHTDKHWIHQNCEEAADLIEQLQQRNAERDAEVAFNAYRDGFISACDWHEPVLQDAYSPAFEKELSQYINSKHPTESDMGVKSVTFVQLLLATQKIAENLDKKDARIAELIDSNEMLMQQRDSYRHERTALAIDNEKQQSEINALKAHVERLRDELELAFYNGYVRGVTLEGEGSMNHSEFLPEIAEDEWRKYLDSEFYATTNYPSGW